MSVMRWMSDFSFDIAGRDGRLVWASGVPGGPIGFYRVN
ncbi:hypothetical protein NT01EI_2160 [Edwardsiella ictaluri 93-146]|uniref:Uncharacterized protein n=1 Tax=Edwardsiella ictaluri (strain 93-146) TaxID=634503 RepID=C5BFQ9_EDWI9|nr:hypothetical protein NT01EI_2160 [Edwardsiella ictaluri 93-146]